MKYTAALLLLISCSSFSFAQKSVTIKDPDLRFSYTLPAGWQSEDDDLYHNILSPDKKAKVALTYFEGRCVDLSDCYLGEIEALKVIGVRDFSLEANGTETISGCTALWARYAGVNQDNISIKSYKYLFIWNEQYFVVDGIGTPESFNKWQEQILGIIRSLEVSKK